MTEPLPDWFRGTLPVPAHETRAAYQSMVKNLSAGVTHIALHCAFPGDIEAISPQHAPWRTREAALLTEGAVQAWCQDAAITVIGYREMQAAWVRQPPAPLP